MLLPYAKCHTVLEAINPFSVIERSTDSAGHHCNGDGRREANMTRGRLYRLNTGPAGEASRTRDRNPPKSSNCDRIVRRLKNGGHDIPRPAVDRLRGIFVNSHAREAAERVGAM
jgi:hypothetical protein